MQLISLNVALFETNNEQLYKFLLEQNPDIVCLQEVADKVDTEVDPNYLSKDLIDKATKKLSYSFFAPTCKIRDFHRKNFHQKENFDFDFGGFLESGNYIKSKFKILKKINIFITDNKNIQILDWSTWPKSESKAVQVVDFKLPNLKKLRVINYHGIWTREKIGNKDTLKACQKVNQLAKEVDYPVIITGDFNLFPDTESMRVFKDFISLVDEHHIKTTRPQTNELNHLERNVVDYILVSKGIKINSFKVLDTDVSDHLPLLLDFDI
ncbi:endonuclease/exonuclease/phosphatase family protein [Candidatus Daviesbacteria bacterium]|nr:endonuclease/exonuclease/phosphatase family protein [Candidatus Daviesbacteria bacterium]